LALHGGAGVVARKDLTPQQNSGYRDAMSLVATSGASILRRGGSALEAVETAVCILEDNTLFNAGRGAVFAADGRNILDASIMDGKTLQAGAVAGVTHTRHPISLARAVMEQTDHVMLIGEQAEQFGREMGLEQVQPAFFFTGRRWRSLMEFLNARGLAIPSPPPGVVLTGDSEYSLVHDEGKHGTVGVVALDMSGNVAAGTSTGGTTGKRWGRVGDSAIVGAGTYAANSACAVSCTGTGEHFIRLALAREVCTQIETKQVTLQTAVNEAVHGRLTALGGTGGVIAVSVDGQVAWALNTPGMYRACVGKDIRLRVCIFADEM
jgi:L-asparaginase / beta-aspartyl-peptidase